jgi:hypothetical protein
MTTKISITEITIGFSELTYDRKYCTTASYFLGAKPGDQGSDVQHGRKVKLGQLIRPINCNCLLASRLIHSSPRIVCSCHLSCILQSARL